MAFDPVAESRQQQDRLARARFLVVDARCAVLEPGHLAFLPVLPSRLSRCGETVEPFTFHGMILRAETPVQKVYRLHTSQRRPLDSLRRTFPLWFGWDAAPMKAATPRSAIQSAPR